MKIIKWDKTDSKILETENKFFKIYNEFLFISVCMKS